MLVVIDYKVGNVKSVCNVLQHIGCAAQLSRDPAHIENADGVILPGVAAFGFAAEQLGSTAEAIKKVALQGKHLMGICVGCQLLFDYSTEHGRHNGLGLIGGSIVPIPAGRTVPHMGWNQVELPGDMDLFAGLKGAEFFYFAHSYYADVTDPQAQTVAADYDGLPLTAIVRKDNIYGLQFHPEKSGDRGLAVLKNFENICQGQK